MTLYYSKMTCTLWAKWEKNAIYDNQAIIWLLLDSHNSSNWPSWSSWWRDWRWWWRWRWRWRWWWWSLVAVVGYSPSDGSLIPGLRDRGPPRGPVSVSNIHSIIHTGSSATSSKGGFSQKGNLERPSPPITFWCSCFCNGSNNVVLCCPKLVAIFYSSSQLSNRASRRRNAQDQILLKVWFC